MGAEVVFVAVKAVIGIVPDAPKPTFVLLFVQLAPVKTPAALKGPTTVPATTLTSEYTVLNVGCGMTVTVTGELVAVQPLLFAAVIV